MSSRQWRSIEEHTPQKFICGHCNLSVGSDKAYLNGARHDWKIFICPNCFKPTFFDRDRQVPGVAYGEKVDHLPSDVAELYSESRNCMSVDSCTAAVLLCRKLLMHIATEQGAPEGTFVSYVNFLSDKGFVPPNACAWVDHIRNKGNEANHEIRLMNRKDAEDLLTFCEMLLKLIFEFPNRVPKS